MKRIFVLNLLLILTILISGIVQAEGNEQVISALAFEGNEQITDQQIFSVIKTRSGDILDEEKLKADLKLIYDMGYFQDVSVSFQVENAGLKAVFQLIEYPIIEDVIIVGNGVYDSSIILDKIGIEKGTILNHNKLVEGRKTVEAFYQDNGYILAKFADINISEEGILTLTISEGRLNEVIINGNEKTKDYVILRELNVKKGQVFNVNELQKSFQKIMRLNYFEEFNPKLERVPDQENSVNLVMEVNEAKTGNLGAGVTWSSKDGWLGFFNIKERNLFGNGQTLGFSWEFGGVTNYSLSFYEPWLFGDPTSFGINLYDKRSKGSDSVKGEYGEHRRGGSISLGHKLTEEWQGMIRFKVENSAIDWVEESYTKDGIEHFLPDKEEAVVRSLTLQTSRDTTNHPFNPTGGVIDTISVEYAGQILGGDANFTKYNLDLRRFYPGFKSEHAWGLRLKAGAAEGVLPELEKYRIGGSETLRGYETGTFSGRDILLLNVEYRFPIADNFVGVVFADGGNAWDTHEEVNLSELHYSLGAGLRMNTPIGQIRLDYGFNEEGKGQPHFSLGHAF